MIDQFGGLWRLLLSLGPLLFLQRALQHEIQAILLILTRRPEISLALFSIIFFPGVLLHEGSHWLMARLLGVRTGRFSLIPQPLANGRVRLGFVETASPDILRDALIGLAPLLAGGLVVTYIGLEKLNLVDFWELWLKWRDPLATLAGFFSQADFWVWFYLVVTVSGTMMPSASDRRAWLPVGLAVAMLIAVSFVSGAGPWMVEHLAPSLNRAFYSVFLVFAMSIVVHVLLLAPAWLAHRMLSTVMKVDVS